jgi:hypothetical protein
VGSRESREKLKTDLRILCDNTDKCKVMHIGVKNLKGEYFRKGKQMETVIEANKLGCDYKQ